ncbi:peptidase of plants and bacteria-domain-containing protein [Chytriomyces sp. MP71]|nr:peptidase of plants and bacteria-domain-containing protein [Chytriomyces sp. MP71]
MLLRPASDSRILVNITHPTPYKHSFPDAEDNTWPVPPINFQSANPSSALFSIWGPDPRPFVAQTCLTVLKTLYSHPRECPSIPCLSIIVRPYDGCAYASNCEVHISEKYVMDSSRSRRFAHELAGCFMHEVVHIFQYNGVGTANGGFVEGVADYVRILNGLAPPQWRRPTDPPASGDKWDRGYEHTAYFLLFVESRMPHASKLTVSMNLMLRDSRWDEALFQTLTGQSLNSLWTTYLQSFSGQ